MDKNILLDDFRSALERLADAMVSAHTTDLEKAGCIQYFEFCFELAWKSIKSSADEMGLTDCTSPKSALKCAFGQGWINDEPLWLDMLASRNRMTHTYDAGWALDIYRKIAGYVPALKDLYGRLIALK